VGAYKRKPIKERFAMIPLRILEMLEFQALKPASKHVLVCLAGQFNGHNNGRLSFTQADGLRFGITRSGTRCAALKELAGANFIIKTHSGGLRQYIPEATHWAIAWLPLQYRNTRELDVPQSAPEAGSNFFYRYGLRHGSSTESEPEQGPHQVRKAS